MTPPRAYGGLIAVTLVLVAALAGPAQAQPQDLDALLQKTREARAQDAETLEARVQRFREARDARAAETREAQRRRDAAVARSEALLAEFDRNEAALTERQAQLDARSGNLGEVFGVVRQVAGDFASQSQNSIVTLEHPARQARLDRLASATALPSAEALEQLWLDLMQEIVATGKVSRFVAPVIDASGAVSDTEVVRVGPFTAIADDRFLVREPAAEAFTALPAQPPRALRQRAESLSEAPVGAVQRVDVDPSRGALLGVLVQTPRLGERIRSGGWVGAVIMALGLAGGVLAVERFFVLARVGARMRRQRKAIASPTPDNPLGRVLRVYTQQPDLAPETLELKLDDAVLREVPALEARLVWLKILAAVAPLLGLLGTVTGMILTFQQITLFGTGDPKLMAGGISQALMTTVQGLIVAIPMVLLHAMLNARSKALIQVLEEESAGLIAEQSERRPQGLASDGAGDGV